MSEFNGAQGMAADEMADAVVDGEQVIIPDGNRPVEQRGASGDVAAIAMQTAELFRADALHVYVRADGRRQLAVTEADLHALARAYLEAERGLL